MIDWRAAFLRVWGEFKEAPFYERSRLAEGSLWKGMPERPMRLAKFTWSILAAITLFASTSASASHRSHAHRGEARSRRGESRSSRRDRRGRSRDYESRGRGRRGRSRGEYESRRRGRDGRHHYYYASDTAVQSPGGQANSGIPSQRVTEIQRALIKGGYLEGDPSGQYDSATVQAMKDFQSANGFSATGLPSASALKKLGVARTSGDGYSVPINKAVDSDLKPVSPEVPKGKPVKSAEQHQAQAKAAAPQPGKGADATATRPRTVAPQEADGKVAAKPEEKKPEEKKPEEKKPEEKNPDNN
ncbi:MAG TPA: peptidoglycan-binding domain-containing protein [Blastocatellia bacterium]|nr:peptidoglycan-binding domain-containing protein [Blastocatellia bacterium]